MSAEPLSKEERALPLAEKDTVWCATPSSALRYLRRCQATVEDVEAQLADCERRERAAVERAEALRGVVFFFAAHGYAKAIKALAADDEARAT